MHRNPYGCAYWKSFRAAELYAYTTDARPRPLATINSQNFRPPQIQASVRRAPEPAQRPRNLYCSPNVGKLVIRSRGRLGSYRAAHRLTQPGAPFFAASCSAFPTIPPGTYKSVKSCSSIPCRCKATGTAKCLRAPSCATATRNAGGRTSSPCRRHCPPTTGPSDTTKLLLNSDLLVTECQIARGNQPARCAAVGPSPPVTSFQRVACGNADMA